MGQVIEAIYDGAVFRPTVPVTLKPNTRVRVTVARDVGTSAPVISFLDTASSLDLDGPADWAANIEDCLLRVVCDHAADEHHRCTYHR